MQITAFTTPVSAGTTSDQEPIWYIRTKEQRMLFLSLDTDAFWREAEHSDIPLSELDQAIFPERIWRNIFTVYTVNSVSIASLPVINACFHASYLWMEVFISAAAARFFPFPRVVVL